MEPVERLVNLIAFLLDSKVPPTAQQIRESVGGYDPAQSDEAFERMFERDKDELRELGIPLEVEENDYGEAAYRIDKAAYYLPPIELEFEEALALRLAAALLSSDPAYPFGEEIRAALLKLASDAPAPADPDPSLFVRLSGSDFDEEQRSNLELLRQALQSRTRAEFDYYSISSDRTSRRSLDPYGLFNKGGNWYVVGLCRDKREVRTFRLSRIKGAVSARASRRNQPDFSVPEDFSVREFSREIWQMGDGEVEASVRFSPALAGWAKMRFDSAPIFEEDDGSVTVGLRCRDDASFVRWILSLGTNATVLSPAGLRSLLRRRLLETSAAQEAEPA